jgi:membrane-bound ClpP family serine protease
MVRGEIWQARASASIEKGTPVRVITIQGLELTVEPDPFPEEHPK